MVKIRFVWCLFFLGSFAAWGASRLRHVRTPAALFVSALVVANLLATQTAARGLSNAAAPYFGAASVIPARASFVRLHYPTPDAPALFGYDGTGVDALFHMDGLIAVRRGCVDLSDYEAITKTFPLVYKRSVDPGQQSTLWALEGPGPDGAASLKRLSENFLTHIDYFIVVGDEHSPEAIEKGMRPMLDYLNSHARLVSSSPSGLVRVYFNGCSPANPVLLAQCVPTP